MTEPVKLVGAVQAMIDRFRTNHDTLFYEDAGAAIIEALGGPTPLSWPVDGKHKIDSEVIDLFMQHKPGIVFDEETRFWHIPREIKPEPITPASVFLPTKPLSGH